jgi:hypothetical protein
MRFFSFEERKIAAVDVTICSFPFSLDLYCLFWALLCFLWFLWVQLPVRVTKDIVETYQLCNPSFQHSENLNPKRYLTNPSIPKFNGGCDNENHDLILYYGCVFVNENATRRYAYSGATVDEDRSMRYFPTGNALGCRIVFCAITDFIDCLIFFFSFGENLAHSFQS